MKNLLALALILFSLATGAHAQDYGMQTMDSAPAATPPFPTVMENTVVCGEGLHAFYSKVFNNVEFTIQPDNSGRKAEKFTCGMAQGQRTCQRDDMQGRPDSIKPVPCEQSCPPPSWNMETCPLQPTMQKAMFGASQ